MQEYENIQASSKKKVILQKTKDLIQALLIKLWMTNKCIGKQICCVYLTHAHHK